MKFIWDNGETYEVKVGTQICGIHKNGERPTGVLFTKEDAEAFKKVEKNKAHKWLLTVQLALQTM
jgi:hypothetical protein